MSDRGKELVDEFVSDIREAVDAEIAKRNLTEEELAKILELFPIGVKNLFARRWFLEEAVRIATSLDIPMELTVGTPRIFVGIGRSGGKKSRLPEL